jgi:glyoxylase-like metal-dependent hydrolase (beta-lactamase superfamily II)
MRPFSCALVGLIAGCAATNPAPRAAGVTAMHVLDCGDITVSDKSQFSPGVGVGQPISLTDSCYVIRHPRGTLLWDTGVPDAIATQPDGIRGQMYHVRRAQTLLAQLTQLGLSPDSIDYLGISHLHFDHAGNANMFRSATWLVQAAEHDAAFSDRAGQMGFDSAQYSALRNSRVEKLNGDYDVFGDSSVVILSTPGHTIGHQSLLVRLPATGNVLLSGDLWHFRENRQLRRVPGFNFHQAQTLASMDRVEQLLRLHNARLIIQHDPQDIRALGAKPATLQ